MSKHRESNDGTEDYRKKPGHLLRTLFMVHIQSRMSVAALWNNQVNGACKLSEDVSLRLLLLGHLPDFLQRLFESLRLGQHDLYVPGLLRCEVYCLGKHSHKASHCGQRITYLMLNGL